MGYRAAFDIDDLLGQTEFARHNDGNGGKRFIDFDALYGADVPAAGGALQGLLHRRDRSEARNMPGSTAAIPYETQARRWG